MVISRRFGLYSGGNRPGSVIYNIADLLIFWIYYCFFLVLKHHMFYLMCMYFDKYQYYYHIDIDNVVKFVMLASVKQLPNVNSTPGITPDLLSLSWFRWSTLGMSFGIFWNLFKSKVKLCTLISCFVLLVSLWCINKNDEKSIAN